MNIKYEKAKEEWIKSNKSITSIAKEFGIDRQCFSSYLKKEGIWEDRKNKYKINKDYFETIDSPDKAYLLGFIAADGCIITNQNNSYKGLDIALQKNDRDFLVYFDILLGNDGSRVKDKENYSDLRIICSKMANDLVQLGIYPRKSLSLDLSKIKIPQQYETEFIRGYFDGDGCFFYKNYSYGERSLISFTGTKESLNYIKDKLKYNCNCSDGTLTKRNNNDSNNYTIQWQGKNQVSNIINFLLSSKSSIHLKRKTQKMENYQLSIV